jgi:hypothetical protein
MNASLKIRLYLIPPVARQNRMILPAAGWAQSRTQQHG